MTEEEEKTAFADFTCHGLAYGLIGLFLADKLLLIRQAASVGRLPFGRKDEVFKVAKICVLSLCSRAGEMVGDLGLDVSLFGCLVFIFLKHFLPEMHPRHVHETSDNHALAE